MILRGAYLGRPIGDQPKDEAEHFIKCRACGGWIDCRDLGQVLAARLIKSKNPHSVVEVKDLQSVELPR
jgi:hypothetical protein